MPPVEHVRPATRRRRTREPPVQPAGPPATPRRTAAKSAPAPARPANVMDVELKPSHQPVVGLGAGARSGSSASGWILGHEAMKRKDPPGQASLGAWVG